MPYASPGAGMHDHPLDCSAARVLPQWQRSGGVCLASLRLRSQVFMTLRGVWISGGVVARSVVYWAGFCRLCRRAALGVAMPRASLNVLRPGTGDLCSRPYALPRGGITAGPSVRPALSTPTQAGCTTGRQQVVRNSASLAERSAELPHTRSLRPVVAPHKRCQVCVRTHTRER